MKIKVYLVKNGATGWNLNAFTDKKDAEEYMELVKSEYPYTKIVETEINNKKIIWG